jgi:LCP family protein required for cell wall assembly
VRLRITAAALLLAGCATTASPSPGGPSVEASPSASPTAAPSPTPLPIDQAMLARRFTVLVVGTDTSQSRRAEGIGDVNTDALMVVSVSADKSRIAIMSLPRDTVDLPMADGSIYHDKVNGIAQQLGIETLRSAMATLLGVPIDRYISVDMDDFTWLVDAVHGIDVEVKTPISDPEVDLFLDPGPAHLDGARALGFSRTRADSDYGRAARQQQVIVALARKWLDPGLGAMMASVRLLGSLETDISPRELPTLLEIGRRSASAEVTGIVLEPPRFSLFVGFEPNSSRGWVMIPDVPEIQAYARSVTAD